MDLYSEFFSIVEKLKTNSVRYAVVGGIAMAFHDNPRFTRDIDILVLPKDINRIRKIFSDLGYIESNPWTFKKTNLTIHRFTKIKGQDHVLVDVLLGKDKKHQEIIVQSIEAESEKGSVSIASKESLIWMKSIRNSDQDKVDIKRLKNDTN